MATTKQEPNYYALSVPECAEQLGVSANHVRNLIKSGQLRASKLGSRVVVKSDHLDRLLEDNRY